MTAELLNTGRACTWLLWALVASCTGTETTNPLTKFDGSGCQEHMEDDEAALAALPLTAADDAGTAIGGSEIGATEQCVVYSLHEDVLRVGLENFPGPCGIDWLGRASFEGPTLVLQGMADVSEGCAVARCGGCTYDLDFEVSGVDPEAELPLRTEIGECSDPSIELTKNIETLSVPLDAHVSGTLCRAADAGWQLR